MKLDEERSKLTTVSNECGRYQYLRTPWGHCSGGDAYTKKYGDTIAGVERKCKCVDETLLYDADKGQPFFHNSTASTSAEETA